jgi:hypothetical protein
MIIAPAPPRAKLYQVGQPAQNPASDETGTYTDMDKVPVRRMSVVGAVLAHGRSENSVAECHTAEGEGLKQSREILILRKCLLETTLSQ